MKLQKYLDETINCEIVGHCRQCSYKGLLERIAANPCIHVMYRCPKCCSINVVVEQVTEPTADDSRVVIFKRS